MELLSLGYWFSIRPVPFLPGVERGLLIFFAVITVLGIIGYTTPFIKKGLSKPVKRVIGMIASAFTWGGIVGLLLWSFSYQGIPVFSMRFFYVLWLAWMLWDAYRVYQYYWIEVPQKLEMYKDRIEREKWIPKKKK